MKSYFKGKQRQNFCWVLLLFPGYYWLCKKSHLCKDIVVDYHHEFFVPSTTQSRSCIFILANIKSTHSSHRGRQGNHATHSSILSGTNHISIAAISMKADTSSIALKGEGDFINTNNELFSLNIRVGFLSLFLLLFVAYR